MSLYLGLTVILNLVCAVLVLAIFAMAKKLQNLSAEISVLKSKVYLEKEEYIQEEEAHVYEPELKSLPSQIIQSRTRVEDDWKPGELREKEARSLNSETLGESTDKFTRARQLLAQGHGMKEVSVVTGLSFSELSLISKTSFN